MEAFEFVVAARVRFQKATAAVPRKRKCKALHHNFSNMSISAMEDALERLKLQYCLYHPIFTAIEGITGREVTSIESYTWQSGRKDDELDHLAAYFQVVELCMAVSS